MDPKQPDKGKNDQPNERNDHGRDKKGQQPQPGQGRQPGQGGQNPQGGGQQQTWNPGKDKQNPQNIQPTPKRDDQEDKDERERRRA
jgi:hypothetical protein